MPGIDTLRPPRTPLTGPSNENTNGLLRQYFPKGTDFSVCRDEDLACASSSTR